MTGLPHDYVCRAQLNGEVMIGIRMEDKACNVLDVSAEAVPWTPTGEFSNVGDAAIIVRVEGFTREEIASWSLVNFIRFPRMVYQYDWNKGEFSRYAGSYVLEGYKDALEDTGDLICRSIWKSPSDPDAWLVNFSPEAFSLFVRPDTDPKLVHSDYWCEIFRNRGWVVPSSKREAHEIITRNYQ